MSGSKRIEPPLPFNRSPRKQKRPAEAGRFELNPQARLNEPSLRREQVKVASARLRRGQQDRQ